MFCCCKALATTCVCLSLGFNDISATGYSFQVFPVTFASLNFIPSSLTWFVCLGLGVLIDPVGGGGISGQGVMGPWGVGSGQYPPWDGAQPGWAPWMVLLQADGVFQPGAVWGLCDTSWRLSPSSYLQSNLHSITTSGE